MADDTSTESGVGLRGSTRLAEKRSMLSTTEVSTAEVSESETTKKRKAEEDGHCEGDDDGDGIVIQIQPNKRSKKQAPAARPISNKGITLKVVSNQRNASRLATATRKQVQPAQARTTGPQKKTKTAKQPVPKSLIVKLQVRPKPSAAKLELSRRLTKRNALEEKPEVQGFPLVWSDSRQALCESVPFFKSLHSGCYSNEGHVYGFLFDGVGHAREYVDSDVIICRAGGGMEADGAGGMVQRKDQLMSEAQVQSVLNDIEHQNPVVVIMGDKNVNAICKMPKKYSVLGWFLPTAVWSEKTGGKSTKVWTTIKYRLERLDCDKSPWFAPRNTITDYRVSDKDREIAGEVTEVACSSCLQLSPQVYLQIWICLNPQCLQFWKIQGEDAPLGKTGLDYDPAFLLSRSPLSKQPEPASLRPPVPDVGNVLGDNLTYINTRGICCPECGRCSSRRLFQGWKCENPGCHFAFFPTQRTILPASLLSFTPWDLTRTLSRNKFGSNVSLEVMQTPGYKLSIYTFEGINGRFIHAAAKENVLKESSGADEMFAAIQNEDIGLERRAFAIQKISIGKVAKDQQDPAESQESADTVEQKGELENLSNDQSLEELQSTLPVISQSPGKGKEIFEPGDLMTAFAVNFGMPYKFVGKVASRCFDDAPWPITEARRRLNWAARTFLNDPEYHDDFNEELIFAYLEGQKIDYHDDGEDGLGKTIATMSLGGRATMKLRMKQKYFVGCSKTGIFTDEKPLPGCFGGDQMYQKRLQHYEELRTLKGHNSAEYNKRRKQIPKELGIFEKKTTTPKDVLEVGLSHGDIIIMDGYDVQKYLEHSVVAAASLRFALTCRTILSHHLKPEEKPTYTVEEDPKKYEGPHDTPK